MLISVHLEYRTTIAPRSAVPNVSLPNMVIKSKLPEIQCRWVLYEQRNTLLDIVLTTGLNTADPTDLTIWEWAFEDPRYSQLFKVPRNEIGGYTNAITGERLDFFQVKEQATHLCTALVKNHGLQPHDTVSLFSHSSIWYPVAMFATLRAGGRVNGASPAYGESEMTSAMQTAKSKFLFTVPGAIKVALAAAQAVNIPRERVFLLEGELPGFTTLKELIQAGRGYGQMGQSPCWRVPAGSSNGDVCGFLTFSSGTTGLPKAVMLSHKNAIAQCIQLLGAVGPEKRIQLACLPLFHSKSKLLE